MRFIVYVVAVLAAAGIVYLVSGTAEKNIALNDTGAIIESAEVSTGETPAAAPAVEGEISLVSLQVPKMHCPIACYPSVKKTLEAFAGVQSVELSEQKEEGVIDNPVVLIKAGENFDLDKAVELLATKGFDGSAVVQ